MSKDLRRRLSVAQLGMRVLNLEVILTAGTPTVSGFDSNQISQVIDVGVGIVTLVLKRPFNLANSNLPKVMVTGIEADSSSFLSASAYDRVTITTEDLAGAAADRSISVQITGCDHRFNY